MSGIIHKLHYTKRGEEVGICITLGHKGVDSHLVSPKDGLMLQILDLISLAYLAGCEV